ncbi:MAG: SUMF1/EgtB/PvdO family nonheme iron enzyme [Spirochaetales bacterium]|nr:SUMF1/EgtB/PvdO family nonheme iron enzyme [Spirochaetales bacterium]
MKTIVKTLSLAIAILILNCNTNQQTQPSEAKIPPQTAKEDLPQAKDFLHKNINYIDTPQFKIPEIYYHGNNNTEGSVAETKNMLPNINGYFFEPTKLPHNLSRTGYSFTGWNTKPDGSGIHYEIDLEDSNTFTDINAVAFEDLHLYAEWEVVTPQQVKLKGGTIDHTIYINSTETLTQQRTVSDFSIGKYEITNQQWYGVISWATKNGYTLPNISKYVKNGTLYLPAEIRYEPITKIEWLDAIVWCNALSELNKLEPVYSLNNQILRKNTIPKADENKIQANWKANGYRLPTTTEWEYASRYINGKTFSLGKIVSTYKRSKYYEPFSPLTEFIYKINDYGWFEFGDDKTPEHPVGLKKANHAGIYDMLGNVSEWCWDIQGASYITPPETKPILDYRGADLANIRNPRRTVMGKHYKNYEIDTISLGWNNQIHGYGILNRIGLRIATSSHKAQPLFPEIAIQPSSPPKPLSEEQQIEQLGGLPINWNTIKLLTYFPWLNQFAPETEYTITVGTAKEARNWLIKLYIEKPDNTGFTIIDFPPQIGTRRTAKFKTSGYITGKETAHYFEVHIPNSDNVYRYGIKGSKPAWFFLTTEKPKLKPLPYVLPFEEAEQIMTKYLTIPSNITPTYKKNTTITIKGNTETSNWQISMVLRRAKERTAELIQFRNDNGLFTAEINTNFLPGEELVYNFYIRPQGERDIVLFKEGKKTRVLSNVKEKYTEEELLQEFQFIPLHDITKINNNPSIITYRRPDPECYYKMPEGIKRWHFDIFYKIKGLDTEWNSTNTIRATNPSKYNIITERDGRDGKYPLRMLAIKNLEFGDIVEYYFYLKIFDTNQEFHLFKDKPLTFKMDWNKTNPSSITDLFKLDRIQFIRPGDKLKIVLSTYINDVDTSKYECNIRYKTTSEATFTEKKMDKSLEGDFFQLEIPTNQLIVEEEILYYFVFTLPDGTEANHGSQDIPYRIRVVEKYPPIF